MKNLFLFMFLMFMAPLAMATPPTEILLSYDKEKEVLHVEATHVSNKPEKHYLRKFIVSLNGNPQPEIYFHRQVDPAKFVTDIPLKAKEGDVIAVEISCSQGGVKTEELTIPVEEKKDDTHKE